MKFFEFLFSSFWIFIGFTILISIILDYLWWICKALLIQSSYMKIKREKRAVKIEKLPSEMKSPFPTEGQESKIINKDHYSKCDNCRNICTDCVTKQLKKNEAIVELMGYLSRSNQGGFMKGDTFKDMFDFIEKKTGFDLRHYLIEYEKRVGKELKV